MKPGPKPKSKIALEWSPDFAYAVGLFTADGCLSKDGRHIDFTSKDLLQVEQFKRCLHIDTKVSTKFSGAGNRAYRVQFSDVLFYQFLQGVGLSPAKSKTLSVLKIPHTYFRDFARGYFDGDGCSYSYYDPLFPSSFRFYISFVSASPKFLAWFREELKEHARVNGSVQEVKKKSYVVLKFAKKESVQLVKFMFYGSSVSCLRRKYLKIAESMHIIEQGPGGEIGKHATFRS